MARSVCVAVEALADAVPGVVRDRGRPRDHVGGGSKIAGRNAAQLGDPLRRILRGHLRDAVERGLAGDRPVRRIDDAGPAQRRLHVVIQPAPARRRRRSRNQSPARVTKLPGDPSARRSLSRRNRPVSPRTRKLPLVQVRTNRSSNRPVEISRWISPSATAWSAPGRTCSHCVARLASTVGLGSTTTSLAPRFSRLLDLAMAREPGGRGIVAPQQDAIRVGEIRRADVVAIGEAGREILVPVADLGGVDGVGAAVGANEALDPGNRILDVAAARRRDREGHLLGPVPIADRRHATGDLGQRLVPGDRNPAGIGGALGLRPPQAGG